MSVGELLQAALAAALREDAVLAEGLTAVFDALPVRSARPWALVEEPALTDRGTKDAAGREARIAVVLHDTGERPVRLRGLAGAVEQVVAALPAELGEGWRIASLALLRSRVLREGEGRWAALVEFRVRMLRGG